MQMLPLSNIFKHKTPAVQLSCKNLCNIKTAVNQPKNTPPLSHVCQWVKSHVLQKSRLPSFSILILSIMTSFFPSSANRNHAHSTCLLQRGIKVKTTADVFKFMSSSVMFYKLSLGSVFTRHVKRCIWYFFLFLRGYMVLAASFLPA